MIEVMPKKEIFRAQLPEEIASCFPVYQELRLHVKDESLFVQQALRQLKAGFFLHYIKDEGETASCMGFRIFETFGWGKILYIDDLITREKSRKKGLASRLLEFAIETAKLENCDEVHLDSGHHRYDAHRLYLNFGFKITCHHFALVLKK